MRSLITAMAITCVGFGAVAEDSDHKAEVDGVVILHAWSQATSGPDAKVFMEIENEGDAPITLTGGEADEIAGSVKIMGASIRAGGEPEPLPAMAIEPGSHLELEPEGVYLHLEGLSRKLSEGDEFEMHVLLEPVGEVEIHVEVEAHDASQHSHAGHNH